MGESLVLALACLCCVGAAAATASAPAPQKAPTSSPSAQPSPDPAPQAEVKPHTSAPSAPAIRRPVVVSSAPTQSAPVTTPRSLTSPAQTVVVSSGARAPAVTRHATIHRPTTAHRPPATHHAQRQVTSLAFPFTLPRDLLLLPRAGTAGRPGGVLLLLSAVAMGAVALAGLSLLRRLRRLELR